MFGNNGLSSDTSPCDVVEAPTLLVGEGGITATAEADVFFDLEEGVLVEESSLTATKDGG